MMSKIRKVIISSGREVGGLSSFSENLASGFRLMGLDAEIIAPSAMIYSLRDLADPTVLKILSTTAVFFAPLCRNSISVAHGFPRSDSQGWFKVIAILVSLKMAIRFSKLVTVSKYVEVHLKSIFNIKPLEVIKNPLGLDFFGPLQTSPDSIERKYITYVGRLHHSKNIHKLLPIMIDFIRNKPNYEILIVGDGPLKKSLMDLSKSQDRISFAGLKSHFEIINILNKSKAFISGCETEAFGIVYLEAISQGCPVIMPRCGGGLEILDFMNPMVSTFDLSFERQSVLDAITNATDSHKNHVNLQTYHPLYVAKSYLNLI